ncbi:hypothetical protein HYPSUDRAFT_109030, partial [Hypholoma sublateritium FD-334 SS-4]
FPFLKHHISETPQIRKKWRRHLATGYQPDKRKKRFPIMNLDPTNLVRDVGPGESACFRTKSGKLVGLVIRNFCASEAAVAYADATAAAQLPDRRNIREDTGKLVQVGWSAGSRSAPQFDWVKNLATRLSTEEAETSNIEASCLFALAWQMMRHILPPEVIADFDNFVAGTGIPRMNGAGHLASGTYQVVIDGNQFLFQNAELAPPGGVIGQNYSRPIHYETQPHAFAVMWTTHRTPNTPDGCHFYLARYGIRIQQASNTLIVWRPEEEHGSSLPDVSPKESNPVFCQRGVAFVTSNRLESAWRKFQSGLFTRQEAAEFAAGDHED